MKMSWQLLLKHVYRVYVVGTDLTILLCAISITCCIILLLFLIASFRFRVMLLIDQLVLRSCVSLY